MKVAALDLGTNSFLCLVAEVEGGRIVKVYEDQVKVVRLGQGVDKTKAFQPEALIRARDCLYEFSKIIEKHQPQRVLAMATSAARDVTNSEELFKIGKEFHIPIEIIPGGREAEITFQGATADVPKDGLTRLIIDVGGGSTEYILGKDHTVFYSQSVDIGCVRLTEALITVQPTPSNDIESVKTTVEHKTESIFKKLRVEKIDEIVAVAGTPSSIAAIEVGGFSVSKVDGYILTKESLQSWVEIFSRVSVDEKIKKFGLEKGRADVILVGAIILEHCLQMLKLDKMKVSVKGVRFGVALELASRLGQ